MQTLISQLLMDKGHEVLTIDPKSTVYDAVKLMEEKNVGSLVILNKHGQIAGIFVEQDALQRVLLAGKLARNEPVQNVMTKKVICALPNMTVDQCLALMTEKRVRHLPVIDHQQQLAGIVSIGDLAKFISSKQTSTIRNLENYIQGVL